MENEKRDVAFIGTGPLSMLEALYQKQQGKNVLLIDSSKKMGGAWTTIEIENLPELEIGCHIWSVHKPSIKFLRDYLELDLQPLKPQPFIYKNGRKLPYDWKMNLITLRRFSQNIKHGRFSYFKHDFKSPAYRFSLVSSKYYYPVRGATDLMNAFRRKIEHENLELRMDKTVEVAELNADVWSLKLSDGKTVSSDKLFVTTLSGISKFVIGGKEFRPKYHRIDYIHVHLVLSDTKGKEFSYIRWIDDPIIHRISDITVQASEFRSDGKRVIIVGVLEDAYENTSEQELVDQIEEKLIQLELIANSTAIEQWNFNSYPSHYIDVKDQKEVVSAAGDALTVLPSSDFIFGVASRVESWQDLVSGDSKDDVSP